MDTVHPSEGVAVTFDLWQTLIFEFDGSVRSHARRKYRTKYTVEELAELGESIDPEVVDRGFVRLSEEITAGHDRGLDARYDEWISTFFQQIMPGLEERIGSDEVGRIGRVIDRAFIESPPHLIEGAAGVLDYLAERGVKIGLISNTGLTSPEIYREWLVRIGLLGKFDYLSFSNEQEVAKPSRAIFESTVRGLGVKAGRTLHVGDNLHTDVAGSAAVGMSTVWVRGGIDSPVRTDTVPDYSVDSILELPEVVDRWLALLAS